MTPPRLILLALATSGLRPNYDQPLELGLLAVDRESYELADILTIVMKVDPSPLFETIDPFVAEMHGGNGLFEDMLPAKFNAFDEAAKAAALEAGDFIERNGATGQCRSPLICFGGDWTERWLVTRFPMLANQFKSVLDMSTVLAVQGKRREVGDGRAESTLTGLYAALRGICK